MTIKLLGWPYIGIARIIVAVHFALALLIATARFISGPPHLQLNTEFVSVVDRIDVRHLSNGPALNSVIYASHSRGIEVDYLLYCCSGPGGIMRWAASLIDLKGRPTTLLVLDKKRAMFRGKIRHINNGPNSILVISVAVESVQEAP